MSNRGINCRVLKDVDQFGQPIRFTFEKRDSFSTSCGGLVSVSCAILLIMMVIVRTNKLVNKSDPFFSMTTMASQYETFDLWEHGFNIAIEQIDPTVGRIELFKATVTRDNGKVSTDIELDSCEKVMASPQSDSINYDAFRGHEQLKGKSLSKFLCITGVDSLPIRGEFSHDVF